MNMLSPVTQLARRLLRERRQQRKARVMYLDGELPVETFKERMELVAARYGEVFLSMDTAATTSAASCRR